MAVVVERGAERNQRVVSDPLRRDIRTTRDQSRAVSDTVDALRSGGVVLLPTDTVYGLLCLPTAGEAVEQVFTMKRRPTNWRLPIIVADLEQAMQSLPLDWTPEAIALAHAFWPGPLTIACKVRPSAKEWLAGRDEAAVRAPTHDFVQSLARILGPLLMTSANQHGQDTPHTMEAALAGLVEPPALAIDGGTLTGAPSTLVNTNLPVPAIEREGAVSAIKIASVTHVL
jgi:L-threonylcarbamoyladenylate synthase